MGNKLFETNLAKLRTDFEYDALYRVAKKLLPEGPPAAPAGTRYQELYTYDKVGNRLTATDANGKLTAFTYDGLNRLTKTVRDPLGLNLESTVVYADPEGSKVNKAEEHDVQKGLRTLFAYDALNRETLRTVKLEGPDGDTLDPPEYVTATRYDDPSHAMTVVDPRGTEIFRRMNGRDQLVEEVVDAGSSGLRLRTTMAYDGLGNRRRVTDPRGNSTLFDFDGLGRLRTMSDALRQDTTYEYDGEGLKTAETDRRGVKRRFTYDNLGRPLGTLLLASISAVPWSQAAEYRDQDLKRIETDARGFKTTYDIDKLGRVVKVTDPDGQVKTLAYDGVNKTEESDKRGNVSQFAYDAVNRLVKVTDPKPFQLQTVTTTYEDAANRVTEKDRRGILRVTQLDPLGRTRSVTRARVVLERHEYDGNGNKTRSLDAENHETRFTYDPANRLSARTDGFGSPAAATTTFKYDPSSNPTEERDARAAGLGEPFSISRTYDELNRLRSEEDGEGNLTRYAYDPEGNKTLETEPKGQKTAYEYEELGKLTKVTQPEVELAGPATTSPVTRHVYDKARNRIRQTDANGHVVEMAYDKLNRMTTMTQDPGGLNLVTEHEYDANGNETKLEDPKGQTVTSTYDELDRLKTKDYAFAPSDPYRPWRHTTGMVHTYDPNSNLVQIDEAVASGTDPPVTTTTLRTHDDLDRLTSETTPLPDGGTKQVAYTYFQNGTRKTLTDPEGLVASYQYDAKNRLQSMTTAFGTAEAKTTGYTYEPDDLLKTVTYPNLVVTTHQYDKADRLTSLTNAKPGQAAASSYVYTYDPNGNRLSQVETNGHPTLTTEETTYGYDALNRLASVNYPDKKVSYGYDLAGNRTSEIEKGLSEVVLSNKVASFDAVNRLTSIADSVAPVNNATFTWDANGNQLTKTTDGTTTEYRYDVRDKLVEVQRVGAAAPSARMQYDAEGRRTKKIGEDGIRQYVYDDDSLFVEYDETGIEKARYSYGSDRLISLFRTDEGRRYFHLDGLRSVTKLTDDAGTSKAAYSLDAWGEYRQPEQLEDSKNRFGFTGHIWDRETSLLFAKARYLDPEIGRFISQDSFLGSIDSPPTLHRYFYAAQNPTRYVDLDGHEFTLNQGKKYGPNEVPAPLLSGTVSNADLKQYLAYVGKHGSRGQVIQATLGATGVYSQAYGQGVAKLEAAGIAGAVAAAPVAIAGGGAVAVGAVGGGASGFVSGLLDEVSATEVAVRTATGAALGAAIGWAAQRIGAFIAGEASPSLPGASKTNSAVMKPTSGEPPPVAPTVKPATQVPPAAPDVTAPPAAAAPSSAAAPRAVPNPYGKLGSPAHQARVAQVKAEIEARGLLAESEMRIPTVGGAKDVRYMDVVARDPVTREIVEVHQVGRVLKSDPLVPVARERAALRDVRRSPELRGAKRSFHEY